METTTQGTTTTERQAEPSLEATCRRFNEAFNRFDTREVAAFWAEDGTLISPMGEEGTGRDAVEAVYRHDCESILAGTTSRFTIRSVRRLGSDLAFLDLDHELQNCRRPDGTTGTMALHLAMLARRRGDGWQWLDARPYALLQPPPSVH